MSTHLEAIRDRAEAVAAYLEPDITLDQARLCHEDVPALLAVAEAAKEVVDHVDLGIEPPGWQGLCAALARYREAEA